MKNLEFAPKSAEEKMQYFEQLCKMDEQELRELFESSELYGKLNNLIKKYNNAQKSNPNKDTMLRTSAIGEAIKTARIKRGLTQKKLGLALGFPESSADVRIAQYESNTRDPRPDMLEKLENVLHCRFNKVHYIECTIEE